MKKSGADRIRVLEKDKGVNIGIYGFGQNANAIARRILFAEDIGGRHLERLAIYTKKPRSSLKNLKFEYRATRNVSDSDLEKIVYVNRDEPTSYMKDDDVILVTGDNNPGEIIDRSQMIAGNIEIAKDVIRLVPPNFHGYLGFVTNPPEMLCYVADYYSRQRYEKIKSSKIFGMTHVDTERLRKIAEAEGLKINLEDIFAVGVHGDIVVNSPRKKISEKRAVELGRQVNRLGIDTMRSLGQTYESTAEACYDTLCAIFDNEKVVVAATPYWVKDFGARVYLSLPVRFGQEGARPEEEFMGAIEGCPAFNACIERLLMNISELPAEEFPHRFRMPLSYRARKYFEETYQRIPSGIPSKIAVAAVLVAGSLAGWNYWESRRERESVRKAAVYLDDLNKALSKSDFVEAGKDYNEVLRLLDGISTTEAQKIMDQTSKEAKHLEELEKRHYDLLRGSTRKSR